MNRKFGVNHCLSGRFGEEKILFPHRELNPDPLVVRPNPSHPQLAVFIHSAVCVTTNPQPLPHWDLHTARSSDSPWIQFHLKIRVFWDGTPCRLLIVTGVSNERSASIFREKQYSSSEMAVAIYRSTLGSVLEDLSLDQISECFFYLFFVCLFVCVCVLFIDWLIHSFIPFFLFLTYLPSFFLSIVAGLYGNILDLYQSCSYELI